MDGDDGIVWFLRAARQDLGSVVILAIEGRVSNATAPDLAGRLAAIRGRPLRGVVIDLSGVDYINGTGLRLLATAATELAAANAELVVCGLRPGLRTIFDMAAPLPNLTIELSADAASRRLLRSDEPGPLRGSRPTS
jgi:stage II sporulation protein AA (anti-sigma F factor antagonist)